MNTPRYETISIEEGCGEVLSRGERIARVDYTVRTRRELPPGGSGQAEGRRLIDGHILVREGETQLRGMGPLVLRLQDGREATFLADLGHAATGAFTMKVSGIIREPAR